MSGSVQGSLVRAAGGVLWRAAGDGLEVAVVHRPRYDDWSLPKGKLDLGEHPLAGAVREVREETGHRGRLGRFLGTVAYHGTKVVDYWAMVATTGVFTANDEVDALHWLDVPAATTWVSYPADQAVLRSFAEEPARTTTVLLVRHGSAGKRTDWAGDDRERPLDSIGLQQAHAVHELLRLYEPVEIIAAPRERCVSTVAPLAAKMQLVVLTDEAFTEEAHAEDRERASRLIREISQHGHPAVVCSQGGLIPDVVAMMAQRDGLTLHRARSRKGSVWALHLHDGRLVGADYSADLEPHTPVVRASRSATND